MVRALLAIALLAAGGCGMSTVGICQGDTCGMGQCTVVAQCTDSCKRIAVSSGDKCPDGYGCLGFVTCVNHDFGNPFDLNGADFIIADLRGTQDMSSDMSMDMSVPADMSVIPGG